jgi:hypothetical protein
MRHLKRVFTILPVLGLLLAGCTVGPATFQGPPADDLNAATVTAGTWRELLGQPGQLDSDRRR